MASRQRTLIPPLTLYRQILRAHRAHLPPQFRILGDGYVKAEFHRHKNVDNPLYIVGFLEQWQDYLNHVKSSATASSSQQSTTANTNSAVSSSSATATVTTTTTDTTSGDSSRELTLERLVESGRRFGKKLDPALLDKMTDQQLGQLYELRKETKGLQSPEEMEEIAKEEAQLFEKVASSLPIEPVSTISV
ncbi:acetate non-utilizing protein 9 [Gryganskiella cystojenkinii]|nr:acetate non-utilizing protein 9 [Gryganskiella cystojenkinii]